MASLTRALTRAGALAVLAIVMWGSVTVAEPPGPSATAAPGAADAPAVADSATTPQFWNLCGTLVPQRLKGQALRAAIADSLDVNPRVALALHAERLGDRVSPEALVERLKSCDDLITSVPPGEWEIFVVAFGYDQIAGVMFAFDAPEDWDVRGFRLNTVLSNPLVMGGQRATDPRPKLAVFDCQSHPDRRCLLLPKATAVDRPVTVLGSVDVIAGSPGALALVPHQSEAYGVPEVSDCFANSRDLEATALGRVDVGTGPGVRPCTSGDDLAVWRWGADPGDPASPDVAEPTGGEPASAGAQAESRPPVDDAVLRVADRVVGRQEFVARFASQPQDSTTTDADHRATYVRSTIDRLLLATEADSSGVTDGPEVNALMRQFDQNQVVERVRKEFVLDVPEPTDLDVQAFYDEHAVAYAFSQIIVATRAEAEAVLARLQAGEPFEVVAEEVSLHGPSARRGGAMSPMVVSATTSQFMDPIRRLAPGETSEPVESGYGFHIFRLQAIEEREQNPLTEESDWMRQRLRMHRQRERQSRFYAQLRETYACQKHLVTAQQLASVYVDALARAQSANPQLDGDAQTSLAVRSIALPDSLAQAVLVQWDARRPGQYTVAEHFRYMTQLPMLLPDRKNPHQILQDGLSNFNRAAMEAFGRERGFADTPEFRRTTAVKREEIAVSQLYSTEVIAKATFGEEEERHYYLENAERFTARPGVQVARVALSSADEAEALEAALSGNGIDPDTLLAEQSAKGVVVADQREGVWIYEETDPLTFERAYPEPEGAVGRVFDADQRWSVFVVLGKEAGGLKPFDAVREQVQQELRTIRSEEVLRDYLDGLRGRYEVWQAPGLDGWLEGGTLEAPTGQRGALDPLDPRGLGGVVRWASAADSDDPVVAVVGPVALRWSDLLEQHARSPAPQAPTDSTWIDLRESMIAKELLALGARADGDFSEPSVVRERDRFARQTWAKRYWAQAAADTAVSAAALAEYTESVRRQVRLRHIVHWSPAAIDSAVTRLEAGEPFGEVAAAVTADERGRQAGGLLPQWLALADLPPAMRGRVAALGDTGQVSAPIETAFGVHLVQLVEARESPEIGDPAQLRQRCSRDRLREARAALERQLADARALVVEREVLVELAQAGRQRLAATAQDSNFAGKPAGERWELAEPAEVVARWQGGELAARDWRERVLSLGIRTYERLEARAALYDARALALERLAAAAAEEQAEDGEREEVAALVARKLEELAVTRYYERRVNRRAAVDEAEARAFYAAHPEFFQKPEGARYASVTLNDPSVADATAERWATLGAAGFETLVTELADQGYLEQDRPVRFEPASLLPEVVLTAARQDSAGHVGFWTEAAGEAVVFRLESYQAAGTRPFAEVAARALEHARAAAAEATLQALLETLGAEHEVERPEPFPPIGANTPSPVGKDAGTRL